MPSEKSISFRSHLLSNVTDLLTGIDLHCARTAKLIVSLISHLAAYTEEGVSLSPTVFVCNSISMLVQRAGAGEFIPLSDIGPMENAASKILKAAAPLCSDNWRIFIERADDGENCRFGVFCGSNDPAALTVDEVVLDSFDEGFPVVRIAQTVTNKVEIRTNCGDGIEFRFNDDVDIADLENRSRILDLAKAASSELSSDRTSFAGFLGRFLNRAIRESHGTLIAITRPGLEEIPPALKDAVALNPPLDLFERYRLHHEEGKTAVSVSRLQTAAELLSGFIRSDGITVVSASGKVLGYRAFISIADGVQPSVGGARTRAYAALCALVGVELLAAFFRSEDGRIDLKLSQEVRPND